MTAKSKAEIAATDAAAAHDAWFRSEVEAGLREAEDPNCEWVSQEEVERRSAERRARWQAELDRRRKSA
jgi:hypothetical protein